MPRCAASRAPSLPEARQADGLQRLVQAGGHVCPRRDELGEPFRENLTHTLDGVTKELDAHAESVAPVVQYRGGLSPVGDSGSASG